MRDKPARVAGRELKTALAEGWGIEAVRLRYVPVGGGSYHWMVHDDHARRWFATVDDLDEKWWLGADRASVSAGLRAAMNTSHALCHDAGLQFVLAPILSLHGHTLLPLGPRYAVAVFPFVVGATGRFGEELPAPDRDRLIDMLAALHRATPAATQARQAWVALPMRGTLETALGDLAEPWNGGPFSEPARVLLANTADRIRRLLDTFDELAEYVKAMPGPVITHGEPHPANVIFAETGAMLIDWDTVGLAPPERDLWFVINDACDGARRYSRATGRAVDRDALRFYRMRWALDDISAFVQRLRSKHSQTEDADHAWRALNYTLSDSVP